MKLVTYDAGEGPRVGALEDGSVRPRLRRRHGGLHRRRRAGGRAAPSRECPAAGASAAALDARLPRLRGPPERRPRPPRAADSRRVVRDTRLLQGNARHGHRPGGGDPVAGVDRAARPRARAGGSDRPPVQGRARRGGPGVRVRLHHLERRIGTRRAGAASCRSAWARPRRRTGTARTCSARASSPRTSSMPATSAWSQGQRRALGRGLERLDALELRGHDRLRVAQSDAAPGRAARLGHGHGRLRARARTAGWPRATWSSSRSRASACCATGSDGRERPEWHTSCRRCGAPRRGRRGG